MCGVGRTARSDRPTPLGPSGVHPGGLSASTTSPTRHGLGTAWIPLPRPYDPDMAEQPPDTRPGWVKRWSWFKNLSPARQTMLVGVIAALLVTLTCVGFYIWSRFDGSVNANSLIGFGGGIIAATAGGAAAVLVLQLSLRSERQAAQDERQREIERRRAEIAIQLADVVHPSDQLSGLEGIAHRGQRLSARLIGTWTEDSECRHITDPLLRAIDAFRFAAMENAEGLGPTEDRQKWYLSQLAPAVAGLADAVTQEALVGTENPTGIDPTQYAASYLHKILEYGVSLGWVTPEG